ncbi:MAG: radical SAM protein [Chloroflexi bacterium]|nr:radical SAM protein [Chloroflexota bacterium]
MQKQSRFTLNIDEYGQAAFPPEIIESFGFAPGAQLLIEKQSTGLFIHRPTSHLGKVYIEPTNQCNLKCLTCIRNAWNEPAGWMSEITFKGIISGLNEIQPVPTIFFGGYGEPLFHPRIVDMVTQARNIGAAVELITNGILLSKEMSKQLIDAGISTLWVSLDGAKPESYADVRASESFDTILKNILEFRDLRGKVQNNCPEIGIAFVAMKRNITDLPSLVRLSTQLGASQYMVTNILPHTREMCSEALYYQTMSQYTSMASYWLPHVNLPRIDINDITSMPLYKTLRADYNISINGMPVNTSLNRCPFIEKGAMAIRWNGDVSPCLPLMHNHTSYLDGRERTVKKYLIGNINNHSVMDLWQDKAYAEFRARVQQFDFSPCTLCGGCDLSETNEKDCYGNNFPTCGGCLWAQGLIQCP